ncbi:MAG: VWA domain-containing protein [Acidobacteriota bacterium]|nr:VWA domain-containing protein [Acidobacteriota bacterium]
MARRRREQNVFSLSFLDAMTCGLGAVILLYLIINASITREKTVLTTDLSAETNLMERRVDDARKNLVEIRNSLRKIRQDRVVTEGESRRLIEVIAKVREELATFQNTNQARRDLLEKLKTDLKTLEERNQRLAASLQTDETPGDTLISRVGDGDRQYLTGLKVGGRRILIMLDKSASMLDETVVNVIRLRNMAPERRRQAPKWQQAVGTVDWLLSQLPRDAYFHVMTFSEEVEPLLPDKDIWLSTNEAGHLREALTRTAVLAPVGGTNLYKAFEAVRNMNPRPDNLILLTDGLPTQGRVVPKGRTVSPKRRVSMFNAAIDRLPRGIPVNVVLLPMEGDPMAASGFWKLAIGTGGSFMSPAEDWP